MKGTKMEKHLGAFVFGLFFLILHLCTSTVDMADAQSTEVVPVKVGLVLDMNNSVAQMGLTCISMALSDFYASHEDYRTRLVLHQRDSKGDVIGAAEAALNLLNNVEVDAIIGPLYSTQANFMINLADKVHVPMITFSATSPFLTSIRSPYFIRAALSDSSQAEAISAIVQAFGWREVVPIYVDDQFGEGIIPYLTDALEQVNARVPYRTVISSAATDDQIVAELYKLIAMQTRVFVVHMLTGLGSRLFTKAKQLGMMNEDYAWIITDGMANELDSIDLPVMESMLGVIGVKPHVPRTKQLSFFEARYKKKLLMNNTTSLNQDPNIFGLWAYDSAIALAMATEKAAGVNNITFSKGNVVSRNFTDLESLSISNAGAAIVQALSSITFGGLAGDFRLDNRELKSPPYEVVNLVGPAARVVGYWTKDKGIVRELKFLNHNTSLSSKSNLRSIIWPGDRIYPPKGWMVPVNGKKLRVLVPVKDRFREFLHVIWNSDNSTHVEGYCIDVFDTVVGALPYGVPYEYIPFAAANRTMAGSYNDLVYQVHLGNFDAVVGDVTIIANRSQYVDFTLPYTESGVLMIVPVSIGRERNAWVFLQPLSWQLWLTSFCSFLFIGVLTWILEHQINEDFRGDPVGLIFWFSFSTMVFAHKEKVISNWSRAILILWFFVVLILTQSYTASLTSMLTVQQLKPSFTDINELIKNHENVGYHKTSFVFGLLIQMNFRESQLVGYGSPEELDELFSKGSRNGGIAAAFDENPYLKLFVSKYCPKYTTVGPTYQTAGFGFVFPRSSPLVPDISRAILTVTESEKMRQMEEAWLGDAKQCPDPSTSVSSINLGLESFWGLFLIVGSVGLLALIVFMITFLDKNRDVMDRSNPNSTIWSKIAELFERFYSKDLSNDSSKNVKEQVGDHKCGCACNCMKRLLVMELITDDNQPLESDESRLSNSPEIMGHGGSTSEQMDGLLINAHLTGEMQNSIPQGLPLTEQPIDRQNEELLDGRREMSPPRNNQQTRRN